jgi:putative membrane protein
MRQFLIHWFVVTVALGATAWILPGVHVSSWPALGVAALVLGLINAVVRPLLFLLTLPITVLTLGLFYFVVNGIAFALAATLVPGFEVRSFIWAILGALLMGVLSWFISGFGKGSPRRSA